MGKRLTVGWLLILLLICGCSQKASETAVEGDGDHESGEAASSEKVIPVRVATVALKDLNHHVEVSGSITTDRDVTVLSETAGRVVAEYLELGKKFAKGDVLASVDAEPYAIQHNMAKAGLAQAKAGYEQAQAEYNRLKELHELGDVSDSMFDQVKMAYQSAQAAVQSAEATLSQASRALRLAKIRAPFKGVIANKLVKLGDTIAQGSPVAQLVNLENLKVAIGVGEDAIDIVAPGMEAQVTIPTIGGKTFLGKVATVGVKTLQPTMTYPVEVVLSDPPSQVRIGMVARVRLMMPTGRQVILLPLESLVERFEHYYLYVLDGERVIEREVALGETAGREVVVEKGIDPGEVIVVTGQNNLTDGAKVQVVE